MKSIKKLSIKRTNKEKMSLFNFQVKNGYKNDNQKLGIGQFTKKIPLLRLSWIKEDKTKPPTKLEGF